MSYKNSVGAAFFVSQTFGAAKSVTIATNANPSVMTSAAHGFVDGDELLYLGGWELANNSVFKADQLTVDTVSPLRLNSSNTNSYGPGSGLGTLQKVTNWIEIPQVLGFDPSGGKGKFMTFRPVKSQRDYTLPDGFEAVQIGFEIGHDPALPNWQTLLDIGQLQTLVAYKCVIGSTVTYAYGYFMMNEQWKKGQSGVNVVDAMFSAQGQTITY
jgi:hypothetical protein